ncbi:MAG: arylsulfatase, partial [Cyclobacteriaceae bacterium]|nr:arylsulfatase [Cyclobacteriaceae bacterium]
MKVTKALFIFFFSQLLYNCKVTTENIDEQKRPNVIMVITDDQGYGDLGFNGNPDIKTPVLDSLARKSTRFTSFYVSPVCAPTRSSLMTGRYSLRTGVYDTYNGGAIMASGETTLAEIFKMNGYHTGMYGKWHLGDTHPHRPEDQGFDETLYHNGGGMGQVGDVNNFFKYDSAYFDPVLWKNGRTIQTKGYCSDVFTDGAIEFLNNNKDSSFFLYLSYNAPHTPLQLPTEYEEMYRDITIDSNNYDNGSRPFNKMNEGAIDAAKKVYGMVTNIDDNLARLFTRVNELGLRENTVIIFLTDNGPQQPRYTSGMRGLKGTVYEGGIHVPFFISMPGTFKENMEIDIPSAHIDVLPTLLDICKITIPESLNIDGKNLMPVVRGEDPDWKDRSLFYYWQRGYDHPYRNVAVRQGAYKLVGHTDHLADIRAFELFNLIEDPGEMNNLVEKNPETALKLKNAFDQWYDEIIISENLLNSPRISIGSALENPVILNRNDSKGPPGIWAQEDRYFYWDVEVQSKGLYTIKC